jgi:membrane protease YdiL (CAAX protease family)
LSLAILIAVFGIAAVLEAIFHAGREQGLDPVGWRSDRALAFAMSALVVAGIAPIVEELVYRGIGFTLLAQFGEVAAIVLTAITFALAHGIVEGIPVFFVIGAGLALLRSRTQSIYPAMLVHIGFNALNVVAGVTT